jgi:hypothetical protein
MNAYVTKLHGKTLRFENPDDLLLTPVEYELLAGYVMKTEEKMEVASTMAGLIVSNRLLVIVEGVERDDSDEIEVNKLVLDIQYLPDADATFQDNLEAMN